METKTLKTFADAEAILAETLPNYESRLPQRRGAEAVERALENQRHLIVEAGCGVGKSLLTLIPAILSGERVIMSTATKALQDQVSYKDVPFLKEHLCDFDYAILKGRSNYFCALRAEDNISEDPMIATLIAESAEPDFGGTREDFSMEIPNNVWSKVCSDSDSCDDDCKTSSRCFASVARNIARAAQVVVVNHHLLMTDLWLGDMSDGYATMLGDYDYVIIDEVHDLKQVAQSVLGMEFSEGSINSLLTEVRNYCHKNLLEGEYKALEDASAEVNGAKMLLWQAFSMLMDAKTTTLRIDSNILTKTQDEWVGMSKALVEYAKAMKAFPKPEDLKLRKRHRILVNRSVRLANGFNRIIIDSFSDLVRWLEVQKFKNETRMVIKTVPIDVAPFLANSLFNSKTVVMVSATAQIAGSFDFLANSLGVTDYDSLDVGSVFDFPNQAMIYIPENMPMPIGETRQAWEAMAPQMMLDLIRAAGGRTLLLFTSISEMNRAYDIISPVVEFKCFKQGQSSTAQLTEMFKADETSCLFATRTFFTGVDIQGASLSQVIINKIPFASPGEPVVEATCEAIKARGGSDFAEFTIPTMVLQLQQACGRLIRHRNDRGVLVLLDSRVVKKSYGKKILRSLPNAKLTYSIDDVKSFWKLRVKDETTR